MSVDKMKEDGYSSLNESFSAVYLHIHVSAWTVFFATNIDTREVER